MFLTEQCLPGIPAGVTRVNLSRTRPEELLAFGSRTRAAEPQDGQRATFERVRVAGTERRRSSRHGPVPRIEDRLPFEASPMRGEHERHRLMVRIQQKQEGVPDDGPALLVHLFNRIASQAKPEATCEAVVPFVL